MSDPIEIKFPFPVKKRSGETVQITSYTPGIPQPWMMPVMAKEPQYQ